jgi:hypothetical protein
MEIHLYLLAYRDCHNHMGFKIRVHGTLERFQELLGPFGTQYTKMHGHWRCFKDYL